MACCVIAAFIVAQCVATLRRWGMFWGVVAIPEGENANTLFRAMRVYLQAPKARFVVLTVVAIEFATLGGWLYLKHGDHIAQLTDIAWSRLHGKEVMYVGRCATNGQTKIRVVLDLPSRPLQ